MSKYDIYKGLLSRKHSEKGWSLCTGAGTVAPIFPKWTTLVENLIRIDKSVKDPKLLADELLKEFSSDAVIQAVQYRLGLNEEKFAEALTDCLYEGLKSKLSDYEWKHFRLAIETSGPHHEVDETWKTFISIRERDLKKLSAYDLAKTILKSIDQLIPPNSILTFNAESTLFGLINSFEREKFLGKVKKTGDMGFPVRRITHSIFGSTNMNIPYIHCHGLLLPHPIKPRSILLKSRDKLVFSENEYLQLANSNFSWQASSFLSSALSSQIVFVGVSLSDSNMRRWLSWIYNTKLEECMLNGLDPKIACAEINKHYWINKKTGDELKDLWLEACVAHLGVQIIWIDEWDDVGTVLNIMLNLK